MLMLECFQRHTIGPNHMSLALCQLDVESALYLPVWIKAFSLPETPKLVANALLNLWHNAHVDWRSSMDRVLMMTYKFCEPNKKRSFKKMHGFDYSGLAKDANYPVYCEAARATLDFIKHMQTNYVITPNPRKGSKHKDLIELWNNWLPESTFATRYKESIGKKHRRKFAVLEHFIWQVLVERVVYQGVFIGLHAFTVTHYVDVVPLETTSSSDEAE